MAGARGEDKILCTLDGVVKRYRGHAAEALGPLSATLYAGEILGVRGSNGAGKSTLLGLIAGALLPDAGSVTYARGVAGQVGFVPQELSLYASLSGLENLKFWGIACGMPGKAIRVRSRWLLNEMRLTEKGKDRVSAYSGGMKRRLHLASALMVTPRLLLLDEPTVGADAASTELILRLVCHLRDSGCGVVMVSHQAGELERVSDRILTLSQGKIVSMEENRPALSDA